MLVFVAIGGRSINFSVIFRTIVPSVWRPILFIRFQRLNYICTPNIGNQIFHRVPNTIYAPLRMKIRIKTHLIRCPRSREGGNQLTIKVICALLACRIPNTRICPAYFPDRSWMSGICPVWFTPIVFRPIFWATALVQRNRARAMR
jgi:hypothetical protein